MTAVQQRPRVRWRILALATGVAASAALTMGTASAAPRMAASAAPRMAASAAPQTALKPALSCGSGGCGDPSATGCWDGNAYVAASAKIYDSFGDYLGYVDNWYSPDCGTNWSEVFTAGGSTNLSVRAYTSSESSATYNTYGYYAWSDQVYAPTITAYAYGGISPGSNRNFWGSATVAA